MVVCAAIDAQRGQPRLRRLRAVSAHPRQVPPRRRPRLHLEHHLSPPGSAGRLRALDDRYELVGFTHYLRAERRLVAERRGRRCLRRSLRSEAHVEPRRGARLAGRPAADRRAGTRVCRCSATLSGSSRAGDRRRSRGAGRLRRSTEHLRQGIRLPLRAPSAVGTTPGRTRSRYLRRSSTLTDPAGSAGDLTFPPRGGSAPSASRSRRCVRTAAS